MTLHTNRNASNNDVQPNLTVSIRMESSEYKVKSWR